MIELTRLHPHRVFLRREALALGYDDRQLLSARRGGQFTRVRHGAYTSTDHWNSADEFERHRMKCHAVLGTHGDGVVLSHTSAAVMHGLSVWDADLRKVHVTRLDGATTRVCHDVRYHRAQIPEQEVFALQGGGFATSPARSSVEHASVTGIESGLVTLDSFLHKYKQRDLAEIEAVQSSRRNHAGNQRLQITLRLARPGAESVGETRLRFLCWEFHLPEPELQVPVHDETGALVGLSDFAWQAYGVLGEFDGRVKYERFLRAGESPADALFREKRREDLMREHSNCSMIRFIWADLDTRQRTAARLRHKLGLA